MGRCDAHLRPITPYKHPGRIPHVGNAGLKVEPAGELIRRIKRLYDRDRRGWSVLAAPDDQGKLDLFISHRGPELWQLKSKPVNPMEFMSLGVEIRNIDEEIRRRLTLTGNPFIFQAVFPQTDSGAIIAHGVGKYSPESTHEVKRMLTRSEGEVDGELARRLEELFKKAYRERAQMHV